MTVTEDQDTLGEGMQLVLAMWGNIGVVSAAELAGCVEGYKDGRPGFLSKAQEIRDILGVELADAVAVLAVEEVNKERLKNTRRTPLPPWMPGNRP
jgi:hypothetical protein